MPSAHPPHDFFAFISYKRGEQDEYYARWLQKKLESYRIPTEIAQDHERALPKRLKVFRDKSDLGSHANLQDGLTKSLGQSRFLIVICSPRCAESPYVDAEVQYFQKQGRAQHIIPFIIDGTPAPKEGERQCYPPSLTAEALGITLAEGTKEEALIKTVARLLQVDFPKLYQRHLRAQRRFMLRVATGLACVLALVAGLAAWAWYAEQRATAQRKEAEELVRFMTFDLRDEAFNHIPIKAQQKIMDKVEQYYKKWGSNTLFSKYIVAEHINNLAHNAVQSGNIDEAMKLYQQSLTSLLPMHEANPNDVIIIFNIFKIYSGHFHLLHRQKKNIESFESLKKCILFWKKINEHITIEPTEYVQFLHILYNGFLLAGDIDDDKAALIYNDMKEVCQNILTSMSGMNQNTLDYYNLLSLLWKMPFIDSTPEKRLAWRKQSRDLAAQLYEQDPHNFLFGKAKLETQYDIAIDNIGLLSSTGRQQPDIDFLNTNTNLAKSLLGKDPDDATLRLYKSTFMIVLGLGNINNQNIQDSITTFKEIKLELNDMKDSCIKKAFDAFFCDRYINISDIAYSMALSRGVGNVEQFKYNIEKAGDLLKEQSANKMFNVHYFNAIQKYASFLAIQGQYIEALGASVYLIKSIKDTLKKIPYADFIPLLLEAYNVTGLILQELQEYTLAINHYLEYLDFISTLPDAFTGAIPLQDPFNKISRKETLLSDIIRVYIATGNIFTAYEFAHVLASSKDDTYAIRTVAELAKNLGKIDEAENLLEKISPAIKESLSDKKHFGLYFNHANYLYTISLLASIKGEQGKNREAGVYIKEMHEFLTEHVLHDENMRNGNNREAIIVAYLISVQYFMSINDKRTVLNHALLLSDSAFLRHTINRLPQFEAWGVALQGLHFSKQHIQADSLAQKVRPLVQTAFNTTKNMQDLQGMVAFCIADAQLLLATNRFDEAEQTLAQAEPVLRLLLERCPANVNAKQYLAELYIVRGDIARHKGDMPKAQEAYTNSCKELEALLHMVPGHVRWKKLLATAQGSLEQSRE